MKPNVTAAVIGLIGWIVTAIGAYIYGGPGLCLISIGLPFVIHNWDSR